MFNTWFFFAESLYNSDKETIPQILSEEFGLRARPISSIFISTGTFINIIAQVLSAMALLTSIINIRPITAGILAVTLMATYVIFGGVIGAGFVGVTKLILLYISVIVGGTIAIVASGGLSEFLSVIPRDPYLSIFGRGVWIDGAAGFSLVLGVLSTQTYIQAILSAKNVKEAKTGALLSSFLIPPIGLAGIFIGLFMKMNHPEINPATAFPAFVLEYMNPLFAGIVLATLLITIIGTGAGASANINMYQ